MIALSLAALLAIQDPGSTPPAPNPPGEQQRETPPVEPDEPKAEQKPAEQKPAEQKPTEQPAPAEVWDDRRARDEIKAFSKVIKVKNQSLQQRLAAVAALGKGSNAKLVDPLAKLIVDDQPITVRRAAADALAHQPPRETKRAVARLLGDRSLDGLPQVQASLVRAFGKAEYEPGRDWQVLDGLFERAYDADRVTLQQAVLELVEEHAEVEAIDLLVANLGEPIPADPHAPSNPPAEYWEARWKAWQIWRGDVKDALFAITGQRFSNSKEAGEWLDKNRKSLRRRR